MDKFEIRNWKFISILLGICFVFLLLVINAFQYIPLENANTYSKPNESLLEEKTDTIDEFDDNNIEDNNSNIDEEFVNRRRRSEREYSTNNVTTREFRYKNTLFKDESSTSPKRIKSSDNRNLSDEPSNIRNSRTRINRERSYANRLEEDFDNNINEVNYDKLLQKANRYKREQDFNNALQAYLELYKMNPEGHQKIELLDNIALLYALTKDYESAIPYAKEAYKIKPTQKRELMLVKLYYKNGQIDIATKRINKILQSNFELGN